VTIEWMPGHLSFLLDGKVIGESTTKVPHKPMHWVLQCETMLDPPTMPTPSAQSNIQVDWVTAYSFDPSTAQPNPPPKIPPKTPPKPTPHAPTGKGWSYAPKKVLAAFNAQRELHHQAKVGWDPHLAAGALAQAKRCSSVSSTAASRAADYAKRRHVPNRNLYAFSVGETVKTLPRKPLPTDWNGEARNWNCKTNKCKAGAVCGHYLQIVWGATRRVGCGGATCHRGKSKTPYYVLVCRFNPSCKTGSERPFPATQCSK